MALDRPCGGPAVALWWPCGGPAVALQWPCSGPAVALQWPWNGPKMTRMPMPRCCRVLLARARVLLTRFHDFSHGCQHTPCDPPCHLRKQCFKLTELSKNNRKSEAENSKRNKKGQIHSMADVHFIVDGITEKFERGCVARNLQNQLCTNTEQE